MTYQEKIADFSLFWEANDSWLVIQKSEW